jgi:hypothetical protein
MVNKRFYGLRIARNTRVHPWSRGVEIGFGRTSH